MNALSNYEFAAFAIINAISKKQKVNAKDLTQFRAALKALEANSLLAHIEVLPEDRKERIIGILREIGESVIMASAEARKAELTLLGRIVNNGELCLTLEETSAISNGNLLPAPETNENK